MIETEREDSSLPLAMWIERYHVELLRSKSRPGQIVVINTHESIAVGLPDGRKIPPGERFTIADNESFVFANGYRIWIGKTLAADRVASEPDAESAFRMLESVAMLGSSPISSASLGQLPSIDTKGKAIELVKAALSAFREPPNSASFYKTVVHSVIEMLDVDRAIVLILKDGDWHERASATRVTHLQGKL